MDRLSFVCLLNLRLLLLNGDASIIHSFVALNHNFLIAATSWKPRVFPLDIGYFLKRVPQFGCWKQKLFRLQWVQLYLCRDVNLQANLCWLAAISATSSRQIQIRGGQTSQSKQASRSRTPSRTPAVNQNVPTILSKLWSIFPSAGLIRRFAGTPRCRASIPWPCSKVSLGAWTCCLYQFKGRFPQWKMGGQATIGIWGLWYSRSLWIAW